MTHYEQELLSLRKVNTDLEAKVKTFETVIVPKMTAQIAVFSQQMNDTS